MAVIEIPDEFEVFTFEGERIAGPVTTAFDHFRRQRPRWLEAELFRREAGGYVVSQVNKSLVWHQPGAEGHIRKPAAVSGADLPPGAVYCGSIEARPGRESCPPMGATPRTLDPFAPAQARTPAAIELPPEVLAERDQRKILVCDDWQDVIRKISTARPGAGGQVVSLSMPMRELIAQAAEVDEAFSGLAVVPL